MVDGSVTIINIKNFPCRSTRDDVSLLNGHASYFRKHSLLSKVVISCSPCAIGLSRYYLRYSFRYSAGVGILWSTF